MSAVERWRERGLEEGRKHPSKISVDSPLAERRIKWKARGGLAFRHLHKRLQARADKFTRKEKVPKVPVRLELLSGHGIGLYSLAYSWRDPVSRKRPSVRGGEIMVGTGGRLRETPIMLSTLYHELGHHKHAHTNIQEYLGVGKHRPTPTKGKGSRKAQWKMKERQERVAHRYSQPYFEFKPVQKWEGLISLRSYTTAGKKKGRIALG